MIRLMKKRDFVDKLAGMLPTHRVKCAQKSAEKEILAIKLKLHKTAKDHDEESSRKQKKLK